ncbi:DMT family transporter [Cognatiyoonia sp. IB215446]|uniref:DMT family transporter n=1 Tax=Cognatiyoonia sp. IB215446 TaxID=3097355 RepID=UPI002A0B3D45|nr:DMT family transporter [Cognatiyoonia sp. IB215446]MDX8350467.1 DMT family transporter [Cognatiyoonia sp. IB215446]
MTTLPSGNQIGLGTAYLIAAALFFAAAPAVARVAADGMNVLALVFWTNVWMFFLMCVWSRFAKSASPLGTSKLWLHFLRSCFTYAAIVTYFVAVVRIPFANAVILQSMGPVFVPILALLVLRRMSDRFVWIGVVISFAGVLLIVRPDNLGVSIGEVSALLAALGGAAAALVIWSLGASEPPDRQMFYFSLFALLLSTLTLPWVWQVPEPAQMLQIMIIALFTIVGQFCYAKAFSVAPGDKVNTWIYMSLVFAVIIGFVVWDEPVFLTTLLGAGLVVAGAVLASRPSD